MVESNDRATREIPVRSRRNSARAGARWKSGLMVTGLSAVVLGAGYLAGVNAPAVNANASAAAGASSGTIARSGAARSDTNQNELVVPQNNSSEDGQVFQLNGDGAFDEGEDGRFFGNQALPGDNGTSQFNGGSGSSGQSSPQLGQPFGGRRNRQLGGLGQQQPNFGGPVTRSRGS